MCRVISCTSWNEIQEALLLCCETGAHYTFCTSLWVFLCTQEPCIFPLCHTLFARMYCQWELLVRDGSCGPLLPYPLLHNIEAMKRKTSILLHTHTHIFFKITKANNLAFFSHHVLLCQKRKPCLQMVHDNDSHMLLDCSLILFKHFN